MRRADLAEDAYRAALADWERGEGHGRLPRLFRARWLDAFTRTPWWTPYAAGLPLAAIALGVAAADGLDLDAPATWAALPFGALSWSFLEYALHRFVFHARARSETARIALFLAHGHHHADPSDRSRLAATPVQLGSALLLLFGACDLAFEDAATWLAFASALLAYVAYEAVHYAAHFGRPESPWLRALRRHHLAHHHLDPRSRWGIGTPLWDWVLGTRGAPARSAPPGD
jgi:dihydroceramide fatty acyl 2-hydroxylase